MSKINTFIRLLNDNPKEIGRALDSNLSKRYLMRYVPDALYLKMRYMLCIHRKLNLKNPITFNEKIQWLKLYYRDPKYVMLVDKLKVKDYIKNNFQDLNVIPTIGVWDNANDVDFNMLPEQFVIKCTHDSGSTIICNNRNEFDVEKAREKLIRAQNRNMFFPGREWVYKYVKPRIIAEPFLKNNDSEELVDYKFMCFNGEVKLSFVCSDRFSPEGLHVTFFDRNWEVMPFTRHYPKKTEEIRKPDCYDQMVQLAEQMSIDMPFVRIDFYEINHSVYFGEYTFFPGSGLEEFEPEGWDEIIGNWITLPEKGNTV